MSLLRLRRTAPVLTPVLAVLPLLAAVACGSSSSTGTGHASSAASSLPADKATGTPVVIGFINADSSPVGDFSDVTAAAKAVVEYLNDNAGGLNGHPIDLETCADNGSTAAAATCAQQLLAKKPAAIVGGQDPGGDGSVAAVTKAGVPYIGSLPENASELGTPGAYAFGAGAAGEIGAADLYVAKTLKASKVGLIAINVSTATGAAKQLGADVLSQFKIQTSLVTHEVTETDLTAAWASASKGSGAVMAVEPSSGCIAAMKARAAAGSTTPLFMFGCSDAATLQAAGAAADGAYFGSQTSSPNATDADTTLYRTIMSAYAPKAQISMFTQSPVSTFMILQEILASSTDFSASAVKTAITAAKALPGFMSPSVTCDGNQVPQLVSLCTGGGYVLQNKGGSLVDAAGGEQNLFAALTSGQ